MSLKGKRFIVTGSSKGIGLAIGQALLHEDAMVTFNSPYSWEMESTLRQADVFCHPSERRQFVCSSVGDLEGVNYLIAKHMDYFDQLDGIVCNAAVAPRCSIEQMPPERFLEMINTNVNGVFFCCRQAIPHLRNNGTIVTVSSAAGHRPFPGLECYGATKAWVNLFSKGLADELRQTGIRVFNVVLGLVLTDMMREICGQDWPKEKFLSPDQVAHTIVELLEESHNTLYHASGTSIHLRPSAGGIGGV